jgi:hypothetical protein
MGNILVLIIKLIDIISKIVQLKIYSGESFGSSGGQS